MHETIGYIGHLGSIAAFIFSIISFYFYITAACKNSFVQLQFARLSFLIHAFSVMTVIVSLFFIIYNHYYEYHYAWSHSSNDLATHYMISCFWEGQEGSFLLWTFWNMVLGIVLISRKDSWEPHVMATLVLIQVVLSSMILGIAIGDFKLGSSPFILLKEVFYDDPIYLTNPDFIAEDGKGLNPLLQNYWMVIHPPTLFLGFSLTQIPFIYAIAGLIKNQHHDWIKKSFSWTLVCAAVLGIGIMMGAFWAYETLNFGGYWNWDPVENAVFVPWIIIVALLHSFSINERKGSALGLSYILAISGFLLILYATFLTRSGILGSASVHSFTDLGLSAQLLIFLLLFLIGSVTLLVINWKKIPKTNEESTVYSREFWIFVAIAVFGLSAFQVLLATSFPVINSIGTALGFQVNLAQPADQVAFYSDFQIWTGIAIGLAAGIGQYIWWNKLNLKKVFQKVLIALSILLVLIALGYIAIFYFEIKNGDFQKVKFNNDSDEILSYTYKVITFILLFAAAGFSLVVSVLSLLKIRKSGWKLSGGAIAHIGVAVMLIGILFSTGYSKVVSVNKRGQISKEFTTEQNKENIVLWRNTPYDLGDYSLTYSGKFFQPRGSFDFINTQDVYLTDSVGEALITRDFDGYKMGDTIYFSEENTYYQVDYKSETEEFTIFPRIQRNESMGGILPSPDIKRYLTSDIYSYIASIPLQEDEWSDTSYQLVGKQDTIFVNDYFGTIEKIDEVEFIAGRRIKDEFPKARSFTIRVRLEGKDGKIFYLTPSFTIEPQGWRSFPYFSEDVATSMMISKIASPGSNGKFKLGMNTSAVDYVILHAERKPLINLVWVGTLLVSIGFVIAAFRRKKNSKLLLS